jgi:hypothetical protein
MRNTLEPWMTEQGNLDSESGGIPAVSPGAVKLEVGGFGDLQHNWRLEIAMAEALVRKLKESALLPIPISTPR